MAGKKKLRKIQLGDEAIKGAAEVATAIWRGTGTLEDLTEVVTPEEDVGYLCDIDRVYIARVGGQLEMDEIPATYEQLPYILEAGINTVAGVQDGGGNTAYMYNFLFPTTAVNTILTYTIEAGDDQQEEEMAYCFVPEFTLKGAADEPVKMAATWLGRQIAPSAFTALATLPTVEEILFNPGKLYIDDATGNVGTTVKSNTLVAGELKVVTGNIAYQTASGALYFDGDKQVGPVIDLDITFEHNATAVAEKAACLAKTSRLIRLKFEGTTLTGATYQKKTLIIDLAGTWKKFAKIDERDGNDIVTGSFHAAYNAAEALYARILVVNALVSLP